MVLMILLTAAVLFVLYLLAVLPFGRKRSLQAFEGYDYAHRGLWDETHPENSLSAFQAAVDAGYGIELDVRLTADGQVVILHDPGLFRMFHVSGTVQDNTWETLRQLQFSKTDEGIHTLQQVLAVVQGRVPLLVEIKRCKAQADLCEAVWRIMEHYDGPWAMESFNPAAGAWFRRYAPQVLRGQLTYGFGHRPFRIKHLLLAMMPGNLLSRPDFIAPHLQTVPGPLLRFFSRHGIPLVGWTVSSPEEYTRAKENYTLLIFQGFRPNR